MPSEIEVIFTIGSVDGEAVSSKAVFQRDQLAAMEPSAQLEALKSGIVAAVQATLTGCVEKHILPVRE